MPIRALLVVVLCLVSSASAFAQHSLVFHWTAMYPSLPPGTVQDVGQLDGEGADELAVYRPSDGTAWIVWIRRGELGQPVYCIESHQFPPGFASIRIGHFDTWRLDASDTRQDLVLIPEQGPLFFATTERSSGYCVP